MAYCQACGAKVKSGQFCTDCNREIKALIAKMTVRRNGRRVLKTKFFP